MTDIARSVLMRMNLKEVAVAAHYNSVAHDLQMLAVADPKKEAEAYMARRGELCDAFGLKQVEQRKPYAFSQGIAILPVSGTLINRFGHSFGYVTGYNFIRSQMSAMMNDPDVKGIIGDFNSYGGEAAGCFECAADIAAMRGQKPMLAVVDSNCYSAAYAIASAFDEISVTPSGGAGSIGVVAMHVSLQEALEDNGIKVSLIHAGDHKVDGNPFEDLPKEVRADIQQGVNKSREQFVELVAANRDMDPKKVRDTEARIYRADEAMKIGLTDSIATPNAALQVFYSELNGSSTENEEMTNKATSGAASNPAAATEADQQQAIAEAAANAQKAERQRVAGILGHTEAAGRSKLANHIAMNTSMSVEEAGEMLAVAPKETAPAPAAGVSPANRFDQAMNATSNPKVGADDGAAGANGGDGGESLTPAQKIIRAQELATGVKLVSVK